MPVAATFLQLILPYASGEPMVRAAAIHFTWSDGQIVSYSVRRQVRQFGGFTMESLDSLFFVYCILGVVWFFYRKYKLD